MPRAVVRSSSTTTIPTNTLIIDNGGHTIKAGFATPNPTSNDCRIIPNCIARGREGARSQRVYVADQLDDCKDFAEMAFRRPVEKGYVVNWDGEMDIWKQAFFNSDAKLHCDPSETNLILTETPNCPVALQHNCDQIVFEELGFASAYRCVGPALNAYNDIPSLTGDEPSSNFPAECLIVVDSGYTQTTITPVIYGRPVHSAIRRLELGGKQLTNYLKELISLRHYGLMDDPYLVSQIKEDACFVSQDFKHDTELAWKGNRSLKKPIAETAQTDIVQEYVLPDYLSTFLGHLRPLDPARKTTASRFGPDAVNQAANLASREESFPLGNERFVVPELIFTPSDIGMPQAGLAEVIVQSLSTLPAGLWPAMLANVIVVGGNAKLPGFVERLESELRALAPADCMLRVRSPEDPLTFTWLGGARLASDADRLGKLVVTKQEYDENGANWTAQRYAAGPR